MSRRRQQLRIIAQRMAFDFEHLFSSFDKRSVRESAYITSFLAKLLSRCSVVYKSLAGQAQRVLLPTAFGSLRPSSSHSPFVR